jgi:hypothetical protein
MILFLLLFLVLIAVFPGRDNTAYDDFCKAECWSRRKPCCRAV